MLASLQPLQLCHSGVPVRDHRQVSHYKRVPAKTSLGCGLLVECSRKVSDQMGVERNTTARYDNHLIFQIPSFLVKTGTDHYCSRCSLKCAVALTNLLIALVSTARSPGNSIRTLMTHWIVSR